MINKINEIIYPLRKHCFPRNCRSYEPIPKSGSVKRKHAVCAAYAEPARACARTRSRPSCTTRKTIGRRRRRRYRVCDSTKFPLNENARAHVYILSSFECVRDHICVYTHTAKCTRRKGAYYSQCGGGCPRRVVRRRTLAGEGVRSKKKQMGSFRKRLRGSLEGRKYAFRSFNPRRKRRSPYNPRRRRLRLLYSLCIRDNTYKRRTHANVYAVFPCLVVPSAQPAPAARLKTDAVVTPFFFFFFFPVRQRDDFCRSTGMKCVSRADDDFHRAELMRRNVTRLVDRVRRGGGALYDCCCCCCCE